MSSICEKIIGKRQIAITTEESYTVIFIIDEEEKSLYIIDDYYESFFYKWNNIGNQSFISFLCEISKSYLGGKIFKASDYVIDLSRAKKMFKDTAIRHFEKGLTKEEKGEILKEINSFEFEDSIAWYLHISSMNGIRHEDLDCESYPWPKKLKPKHERILKIFENDVQPYLEKQLQIEGENLWKSDWWALEKRIVSL